MISASPVQRRLPMHIEMRTPLMCLNAVKAALRCDEDQVLYLIVDKQLIAFDLKTPIANKVFPRIVARSVSDFQSGASAPRRPFIEEDIFPHTRPWMKGTELMRDWNVGSDHIHNLINAGCLKIQNNTGDDINQTPLVTRASALAFLKERRM